MKQVLLTIALLALVGCAKSPETATIENNADMMADNLEATADRIAATADNIAGSMAAKQATEASNWSYNEQKDQMRGGSRKLAAVSATETLHLAPPYGDTTPELNIRRDPKFGFDIFVTSEGQPQCPYNEEHLSVKFDNGPVREWSCSSASDGSPGVVFFDSKERMLKAIKGAKRMIVEINYYDNGRQQITFPVADLKW